MEYYYAVGDQRFGPMTLEQIRAAGLRADVLVWRDGMANWLPAGQVPELADIVAQQPVVQPAFTASINYATATTSSHTNGMAIASMVLGILSLPLLCACYTGIPAGILAIIFGLVARKQIRNGFGQGDGMAKTGIICGIVGLSLPVVFIGIYFFGRLAHF